MTRKKVDITISVEGRDKGKIYVLEEMSAYATEKWAARFWLVIINSGMEVPTELKISGMAGVAAAGFYSLMSGRLNFFDVEPLMDDMLKCISLRPDPAHPELIQPLNMAIQDQIEEVETLWTLRLEVIKLHIDFLTAGSMLERLQARIPASWRKSSTIQTSPTPLVQ